MMNNHEKLAMILRHIRRVEENCHQIALKLLDKDEEFACKLVQRGRLHDASKFDPSEWHHLWSWDELFPFALKQHRTGNRHHLEYHQDVTKMTDLDVAEMVCDCAARSAEFGTDLRKWFERPEYKPLKDRIDYYLDLLLYKPFVYPKLN